MKLIRHLCDENIVHHTYQLKQDRAYRVVIRNLHHSVPLDDIKQELHDKGHIVRNIINARLGIAIKQCFQSRGMVAGLVLIPRDPA